MKSIKLRSVVLLKHSLWGQVNNWDSNINKKIEKLDL